MHSFQNVQDASGSVGGGTTCGARTHYSFSCSSPEKGKPSAPGPTHSEQWGWGLVGWRCHCHSAEAFVLEWFSKMQFYYFAITLYCKLTYKWH